MSEKPQKAQKKRRDPCTGTQVHPARRKACVAMLVEDTPITKIRDTLKMDPRTIHAIAESDLPDVQEAKLEIAKLAYRSSISNLKSAIEQAENGKGSALAAKFSWEIYAGAVGEPSQITDVNHIFPQLSEFGQLHVPTIRDVA